MFKRILPVCLIVVLTTGCTAYKFSKSADDTFPAKPEGCKFKVTSALPTDGNYEEIGTINFSGSQYAPPARDLDGFREKISEIVCKAGGDVVVGDINGFGLYVRGTVFVKK